MSDTFDKRPARILVVEDDVHLLDGLKDILERESYTIITAENGVEALQALEAHPVMPDLVLLDLMMPEMDGLTFLRELQKKPHYGHIPIIILSARTSSKSEALALGAALFIMKPFDARELLVAIAGVLATRADNKASKSEASHRLDRTPDDNQPARILVVEDDVHVLAGMRDILEREGYRVITALNGVEGLHALEAHPDVPDLIIANVLMPEMDGFTFVRELRKRPQYKHIPYIIESAQPEHKNEALESGAALFFTLPFHGDELLNAVADVLTGK